MVDTRRLDEAVDAFVGFVRHAPPEQLRPSATAGWGTREVLIHLVVWHETYVRGLRRRLAGQLIDLPSGTFRERNARMIAEQADCSIDELLTRWQRAQAELRQLAADPRAAALDVRFKQGGKEWAFPDFIVRVTAHIRNHQAAQARVRRRAERTPPASPGSGPPSSPASTSPPSSDLVAAAEPAPSGERPGAASPAAAGRR